MILNPPHLDMLEPKPEASALIESVPNFSEGRNPKVIGLLSRAADSVRGARLLDQSSDADHNRTVLTIAGQPAPVAQAVFETMRVAIEEIRLPEHQGVHPRMGAVDVVPFVPVRNVSLAECAEVARAAAARFWTAFGVPVFLYEAAARDPSRRRLETLRSPKFTGEPDVGAGRHRTAGACAVGARDFLIAWNVNLESKDLTAAREIARSIRESSGGLPCVKALGLELRSRHQVQVSMNLTNFERTPLHVVFNRILEEADARGIRIAGSELIGLIPQRALDASSGHELCWLVGDRIRDSALESRVAAAKL